MNSIGEQLKSAREAKGYTLELIARETNISRSYLQALEEDNYDSFPAEPYLIGFLRNYSIFLGLSPEELVTRYRNLKIQEQPAPMEALVIKKNPIPTWTLPAVLVLAAAGVLLFFLVPSVINFLSTVKWDFGASQTREAKEYSLAEGDALIEERFYLGDSVRLSLSGQDVVLAVETIGQELTLTGPQGQNRLRLGEEVFLDLNSDSDMDLRVFLGDISPSEPAKGVALVVERIAATSSAGTLGAPAVPLGQEALAPTVVQPEDPAGRRTTAATVILEDDQAKPFSLDVVFRGYAFFRYQVDDKLREEGYFQKGETVRVEASKKAVVWVSNAGSFVGRVSGSEVEIGRPGEVAAGVIQWSRNAATGKFQLRLEPLY